jgi:hypothetical protein
MNGRIGRTRELARIRRQDEREARAEGVDPTDRVAFAEWKETKRAAFYARLSAELAERRAAN